MASSTSSVPLKTAHTNAFITSASSGSNAVVAAVAGARFRVLSVVVVSTLANAIKFMSAATDISATFPLGANGGFVMPFNEHGWFETAVGEALNINLGTATSTGVHVQYIRLPG